MRIFLVSGSQQADTWLHAALETLYGPALPVIAHAPDLAWDALPQRCMLESPAHATEALLTRLQAHGFRILCVVGNPLDILVASSPREGRASNVSPFFEYAAGAAFRETLLRTLEWSRVDDALAIRRENWAFYQNTELDRLRRHCGEFSHDAIFVPAAPSPGDEPDFWRRLLPIETAREIHARHAGLFCALGYHAPVPVEDATEPSVETKRLRHELLALENAHLHLREDMGEVRKNRAKTTAELRHLHAKVAAEKSATHYYHRLVHGVGVGQHLHRAWQVLIGNRHYRQSRAVKPTAPAAPPLPDHFKGYEILVFGDLEVRFHREALQDKRGTGRVANQLLISLKALQTPSSPAGAPRRVVHFFTAPHWGPETFPERTCMVIHDVIPSLIPDYPKDVLAEFEKRCRNALPQIARLISISAASARDVARVLDYPEDKITVIHNGVSLLPVATASALKLPDVPFVAYVGGDDRHKNLEVLIEALRRRAARHVHLVMVGENSRYKGDVQSLGLEDRVHFLGHVSDAEVGHVLKQASAFVFPSYYEGFGLPPLEAALLGTPSICSRRPAMTELLDGAAIFADHESPDDWAACMHLMTTSPDFAREIGQLARIKAERLQWSATARAYLKVFQSMA